MKQNAVEMNQIGFDKTIIDNRIEKQGFENVKFWYVTAEKIEFDGVIFSECNFSYGFFESCIFKNCQFINCTFFDYSLVGNQFVDCEMEGLVFDNNIWIMENTFKRVTGGIKDCRVILFDRNTFVDMNFDGFIAFYMESQSIIRWNRNHFENTTLSIDAIGSLCNSVERIHPANGLGFSSAYSYFCASDSEDYIKNYHGVRNYRPTVSCGQSRTHNISDDIFNVFGMRNISNTSREMEPILYEFNLDNDWTIKVVRQGTPLTFFDLAKVPFEDKVRLVASMFAMYPEGETFMPFKSGEWISEISVHKIHTTPLPHPITIVNDKGYTLKEGILPILNVSIPVSTNHLFPYGDLKILPAPSSVFDSESYIHHTVYQKQKNHDSLEGI